MLLHCRDVARNTESMRWICATSSEEDRLVAQRQKWTEVPLGDHFCRVQMLDIEEREHNDFYAVIANPLLWFIQHNLWDHGLAPDITTRSGTRGSTATSR